MKKQLEKASFESLNETNNAKVIVGGYSFTLTGNTAPVLYCPKCGSKAIVRLSSSPDFQSYMCQTCGSNINSAPQNDGD